jgi:hypothetical protein
LSGCGGLKTLNTRSQRRYLGLEAKDSTDPLKVEALAGQFLDALEAIKVTLGEPS